MKTPRSTTAFTAIVSGLFLWHLMFAPPVVSQEVTIAAFDNAAPAVFSDAEGKAQGIFPDILKRLLEDAGYRPRFVTGLSFNEAYDAVVAGEIDLLPGTIYSEDRDRELDFSGEPVMVSWGQLGVSSGAEIESVLELRDRRIGLMYGDQNGLNFIRTMTAFDISFEAVYFDTYDEIVRAILDRQIVAGVFFSSYFHNEVRIVPTSIIFSPTQAFVATSEGKNQELLTALDQGLRSQKADPDSYYHRTIERWLTPRNNGGVPQWVWTAGAAILLVAGILAAFNVILRQRVRRATNHLQRSRERYRTVADHAYGWEFWMAPDGDFVYVSPNTKLVTGYPADTFLADPGLLERIIMPEDRGVSQMLLTQMTDPSFQEANACAFRIRRADGSVRWIEHRGTSVFGEDGSYAGYRGSNIDITERMEQQEGIKRALREKELLLKEVHHRVKNNLQTIASLVSIQRGTVGDPTTIEQLDAIAGRVHAMAALHAEIYREDSFGLVDMAQYARSIVNHLQATMDPEHSVTCGIRIRDISLGLEEALPCGLIVSEAVTNAFKHAFSGHGSRQIEVIMSREEGDYLTLTICDNGRGFETAAPRRADLGGGIGLALIETLTMQLRGDLVFDTSDEARINIRFESSVNEEVVEIVRE